MKSDGSILDRFLIENDRLMVEAKQADKEAKVKLAEYEGKLKKASTAREKGATELETMIADFKKIEVQEIEVEREKIEPQVASEKDVLAGRVSVDEYYQKGLDDQEIDAMAKTEATKKTDFLLQAVRIKGLEVLRLEVEEAEVEKNIMYLSSSAASSLLEKMRAQIKELERVMAPGVSSGPDWTMLHEKKECLARAEGQAITGAQWNDLDINALKLLRFDASIPDSEISALQKIIAEMESRGPGSTVTLRFLPSGPHKGLSVLIWREK